MPSIVEAEGYGVVVDGMMSTDVGSPGLRGMSEATMLPGPNFVII